MPPNILVAHVSSMAQEGSRSLPPHQTLNQIDHQSNEVNHKCPLGKRVSSRIPFGEGERPFQGAATFSAHRYPEKTKNGDDEQDPSSDD